MTSKRAPLKVGICGSYGGLNLGDEAILQGILTQLRQSLSAEITIFSRNAEDTLARHQVERAIPVRALSRDEVIPELERLDLLILGGGGILFDSEAKAFVREASLAHELDVPVMIYAVSAGPLEDPTTQRLVCECLERAALVTVREREAQRILEEAGLKREVIVTADPALFLPLEPISASDLKREGLDGKGRLVGMSVREPGGAAPDVAEDLYHSLLANVADFIVERYDSDVVLVPLERQVLDMQHSHAVVARMLRAERATVLRGEYTPGQLLSIMKRFDFAVGMRLHFLLFAALQGIPFVALPYASKVRGFLADLELETPPLARVNAGRLVAYVDHAWDERRSLAEHVQRRLPALKARAARTHEMLLDLVARLPGNRH
jgi:polysaccharide pyruvyl transferase CsaB